MTHEECKETLALHALDSVGAAERQRLEAHLEACLLCAADLAELREAAASLASLARPIAPSPDHLERVLGVLDAAEETPSLALSVAATAATGRAGLGARWRWRPLVLTMRLAVAGVVALLLVSQVRLLRRLDEAHLQINYMRRLGSFVTSPDVSVVPLWGARVSLGAHAKLAYDRTNGRFVFLSSQLMAPPAGKRYQVWVIADGVRPAAAFLPDSPDGVFQAPPRGDGLFLFAVSVEPPGEVDEPTGPMVLMSGPLRGVQ